MTRTGKSQRLSQHCAEPYVEIHPQDAARHHIGDADLVRVSTGLGAILVRALLSPRQQLGSIFVPMHWNDQFAARARVDALVAAVTDPISGQPASKNIPARVERFVAAAYGFAVLRRKPADIDAEYWAIAKCNGGWRVELAFAAAGRRLAGLRYDAGRRRRAEVDRLSRCRKPGGIALPATKTSVSPARSFSRRSRSPSRATGRSSSSPHRTRARRARFSVMAGRPGKAPSIAAPPSAPASASAPTRSPRPSRAAARRSRRSASAASRHQLRLLPRRNPQHHRRATRHCAAVAVRVAVARSEGPRCHGHLQTLSCPPLAELAAQFCCA